MSKNLETYFEKMARMEEEVLTKEKRTEQLREEIIGLAKEYTGLPEYVSARFDPGPAEETEIQEVPAEPDTTAPEIGFSDGTKAYVRQASRPTEIDNLAVAYGGAVKTAKPRTKNKPATKTIEDESARCTTHKQMRYRCRACHSVGIAWVEKTGRLTKCPDCGTEVAGALKLNSMPPEGRCDSDSVWGEEETSYGRDLSKQRKRVPGRGRIRTGKKFPGVKVKKVNPPGYNIIVCDECAHVNKYRISRPSRCNVCGHIFNA